MSHRVITKQYPHVQLAHLYEHIFCDQLAAYLRSNHRYPVLDYHLDAKTYHGGVVYIACELYNEATAVLFDKFLATPLRIEPEFATRAANQIIAERSEQFASDGYDIVNSMLKDLDTQRWKDIDKTSIIDTRHIRRSSKGFYAIAGDPITPYVYTVSLMLEDDVSKNLHQLLPLFRQISWFITANLQQVLASEYGFFPQDNEFIAKKETVLNAVLKIADVSDFTVDSCAKTCKEVIHELIDQNGFVRFVEYLHDAQYTDHFYQSPAIDRTYEDTLMVVGSLGWQELATSTNLDVILSNAKIRIRYGKKTTEFPIKTLM